jgi:hypothetical protein
VLKLLASAAVVQSWVAQGTSAHANIQGTRTHANILAVVNTLALMTDLIFAFAIQMTLYQAGSWSVVILCILFPSLCLHVSCHKSPFLPYFASYTMAAGGLIFRDATDVCPFFAMHVFILLNLPLFL